MNRSGLASKMKEFLVAPETDTEFVRKFMSDLQQREQRYAKGVNLGAAEIALLSAFFLLLSAHGVGEFTVFGVKITRYSALAAGIPPIIALLLIRITTQSTYGTAVRTVYDELVKQAFPAFEKGGLHETITQNDIPFVEDPDAIWEGAWLWTLLSQLTTVITLIVFLAPFAFFVYAFYILFHQYHARDIFLWLSLSATSLLSVLAMIVALGDLFEADTKNSTDIPQPAADIKLDSAL
jgi:heme A synthase